MRSYLTVWRLPSAPVLLLAGFAGRLPSSMVPLALLLMVQEETGSYAVAGSVSATYGIATALVAPVLVLGIYIVVHGHLTPGGGFQGGVVLMTAFFLVYLGGSHLNLGRLRPLGAMEASEGLGAAGFALIGLGGIVLGSAYLENFIAPGQIGFLISGGVMPLLNVAVGLEVMGALVVVIGEFLDQRMLRRRGRA